VQRIFDPDVFWHIRAGQWIWQTRSIPTVDPFSYTSRGPWTYCEVLADVGVYTLHVAAGWPGVVLGTAALAGVLALAMASLSQGVNDPSGSLSAPVRAVAVTLGVVACAFRLGPKTEMFSFLGFAGTLAVLARAQREARPALVLVLAPAFAIWGNLHRGGTLGLAVVALTALAWAAQRETRRLAPHAALATVLGAGALLLNTGGIGYVTAAFALSSNAIFRAWFPEWAPMQPSFLWRVDPAFSALAVAWIASLPAVARAGRASRQRRAAPMDVWVVPPVLFLSASSVRFVPFAAIAMVPGAARLLGDLIAWARARAKSTPLSASTLNAACLTTALALLAGHALSIPRSRWGTGLLTWRVPVAAGDFLRTNPPPGTMWNSFVYGGYLLYALAPEHKVFIDGRNDTVYESAFLGETLRAAEDQATFDRQSAAYGFSYVVMACTGLTEKRAAWLYGNPAWGLVHLDDLAAILVQRTPVTRAYLEAHELTELRPTDAVARASRWTSGPTGGAFANDVARDLALAPESLRAQVLGALLERTTDGVRYQSDKDRITRLAAERGITIELPAPR
jgi:hypothetical protein